jgi:acyl-CoA thioesterase FadM
MTHDQTAGAAVVEAVISRRVPPRHCDAQGMLHASRPAEYLEDAFLAWLDEACGGYPALRAAAVDLVIAETTITYRRPIRLDEQLTVRVTPVERGTTSLRVRFDLHTAGSGSGGPCVTATTTYVCVAASGPTTFPPPLARALGTVPERTRPNAPADSGDPCDETPH